MGPLSQSPVGLHAVRETQPRVVFWVPCHLMFQPSSILAFLSCCVSIPSEAPCPALLAAAATSSLYPNFVRNQDKVLCPKSPQSCFSKGLSYP